MNEAPTVNYAEHGFQNEGLDSWVRRTELHVTITVASSRHQPEPFGVYVFHGHPGGAFWRNREPLLRCRTLAEALDKAETLYGITGSGQFARIVSL